MYDTTCLQAVNHQICMIYRHIVSIDGYDSEIKSTIRLYTVTGDFNETTNDIVACVGGEF